MKSPVIVWTMGKVGSSSIYNAIKAANLRALQPHYCDAESLQRLGESIGYDVPHIKDGRDAAELIERATPESPALIVTMVRTPIERNISAYFQNKGFLGVSTKDPGESIRRFMEAYSHYVVLHWLDGNLKKVLGLDVYAEPFDKEKGFRVYDCDRHKVLLFRSDLRRSDQCAVISRFLGRPIAIKDINVAEKKRYADEYRAFLDRIVLPKDYVDQMLSSRYAQHFWPTETLDQLRTFWLRKYAAVD